MQLDPAKVKNIPAGMTAVEAWDAAVDEANRTYCKRMHNLFCDNCHSHVCRALQTMEYSVGVLAALALNGLLQNEEHAGKLALTHRSFQPYVPTGACSCVCMPGLDALQHGHARCWMLFRWKACFLRPHVVHFRTLRDYS